MVSFSKNIKETTGFNKTKDIKKDYKIRGFISYLPSNSIKNFEHINIDEKFLSSDLSQYSTNC